VLEILVIPVCFIGAGLLGFRLGTPQRVAGGLVAVGGCHLLAFLGARQALAASGESAAWIHFASQLLFLGGFVVIVWLAAVYPDAKPPRLLIGCATALGAAGPLLAAVSGPTPSILDEEELGPIIALLPGSLAAFAVGPLLLLPLLAVGTFFVRYRRATATDRAAMRWPIFGLATVAGVIVAGNLLGRGHESIVTGAFFMSAPILPLAMAFGPVARRIQRLTDQLDEGRKRGGIRPGPPPGVLARLTPRELDVLQAMASGAANPVIARRLHLSLSSVEKHATSIFRKFQVDEGPEVHRRVAAVVTYRDALQDPSADE